MSEEFTAVNESRGNLAAGLFLCWGLNFAEIMAGFFLLNINNMSSLAPTAVLAGGIGMVEWLYVIPLYMLFKSRGKPNTAKGLIIAAGITALLNGLCWSPFLFSKF